jgi:hypothetical protein
MIRTIDQRTVNFFGFFQISVPSQWQCHMEEDGSYGCYEENVESGTLWVRHFAWKFPGKMPKAQLYDFVQNSLMPKLNTMGIQDTLSQEVFDLPNGDFISEVLFHEKDPNDGAELQSRRWHFVRPFLDRVVIISATLVLPNDVADKEIFLNLVDVMRNNIEAATILHTNIEFENIN